MRAKIQGNQKNHRSQMEFGNAFHDAPRRHRTQSVPEWVPKKNLGTRKCRGNPLWLPLC